MTDKIAWSIQPTSKKSIIERNEWFKGDNCFKVETVWRWGEYIAYTDDENPPKIEPDTDIFGYDYDIELVEGTDGDEYHDMDACDEETTEWLDEFLESHTVWELEEHGWSEGDAETVICCEISIERKS